MIINTWWQWIIRPLEKDIIQFTAWPWKFHELDCDWELLLKQVWKEHHLSPFFIEVIKTLNNLIFKLFWIPENLRNTEFVSLKETPEWWHVWYIPSWTWGMQRALHWICKSNWTLIVDTDTFSKIAIKEIKSYSRQTDVLEFPKWEWLIIWSEKFEQLVDNMKSWKYSTIYLTENWTTTWVNQSEAIDELIKIRNKNQNNTLIVVDAVSSQIFWKFRKQIPDVIFWADQKDIAISTWWWNILFNNRALARVYENKEEWLDVWWKIWLLGIYWTNDHRITSKWEMVYTPDVLEIYKKYLVMHHVIWNSAIRQEIAYTQEKARKMIKDSFLELWWLQLITQDERLQSLTSHVFSFNWKANELIFQLRKQLIAISPWFQDQENKIIRICTYSANTIEDVKILIEEIEEIFRVK